MKRVIFYFLLCFFASACNDFLTTPPLDQIAEGNWWSNKSQVQMMVDDCYSYLPNDYLVMEDCATDNAKHRSDAIVAVGNGTYDTSNGFVASCWKYDAIARLNYVLEGIEKSKRLLTDAEYKQFKAQIRFIRAFNYYYMLFRFGDIPLITKTLTIAESYETPRQPRAEVLAFVVKELEEGCLTDIDAVPVTQTGRVNKDVINGFLARINLYEKNYDKALTYTNAVINTGKYELYSSYGDLFRPQTDGKTKEIIFERQYSSPNYVHALNRNLTSVSSVYKGWSHCLPLQSLVDEYECINGHPYKDCEKLGCEYFQKRKNIETANPTQRGEYQYRDTRFSQTVAYPFWEWKVDGVVRSVFGVDDPNSGDYVKKETHMSGYLCIKWLDLRGENIDRTLAHKNITIIRYADILLMKAEALIEKNQDLSSAASLINQIRKRAGMPENILATTQDDLRTKLRHERRVETALEGLRYYDIIRWKIADQVKVGSAYGARLVSVNPDMSNKVMEQRYWNDKMYLFPIPQNAIDRNPSLTQNQGWQ